MKKKRPKLLFKRKNSNFGAIKHDHDEKTITPFFIGHPAGNSLQG